LKESTTGFQAEDFSVKILVPHQRRPTIKKKEKKAKSIPAVSRNSSLLK
jgi:hypothetical protein